MVQYVLLEFYQFVQEKTNADLVMWLDEEYEFQCLMYGGRSVHQAINANVRYKIQLYISVNLLFDHLIGRVRMLESAYKFVLHTCRNSLDLRNWVHRGDWKHDATTHNWCGCSVWCQIDDVVIMSHLCEGLHIENWLLPSHLGTDYVLARLFRVIRWRLSRMAVNDCNINTSLGCVLPWPLFHVVGCDSTCDGGMTRTSVFFCGSAWILRPSTQPETDESDSGMIICATSTIGVSGNVKWLY